MLDQQEAKKVSQQLNAIGEPTRLRILYAMAEGPKHVGQLAKEIGIPMVNMSHHLGVFKNVGIAEDETVGRNHVYKLKSDVFAAGSNELQFGSIKVTLNFGGKAKAARK